MTALIRWVSSAFTAFALFLTFRFFIPGLVNLHNDGALIAAMVLAIAVPAAAFVTMYKVWTETFE